MKIKDLPKGTNLGNIRVKVPDNIECQIHEGYWRSQWGYPGGKAGVWLTKTPDDSRVYPICINSLEETLEWEIIE